MKRFTTFLALAMIIAVPALAGDGYKCTASTQECLDKMAAKYASKGWAGLEGEYNEEHGTYTLTAVNAGSPADAAGFEIGDILFAANGTKFADMSEEDHKAAASKRIPGAEIEYTLKRDGKKMAMAVTLEKMPEEVIAKSIGKHLIDHVTVASVQ